MSAFSDMECGGLPPLSPVRRVPAFRMPGRGPANKAVASHRTPRAFVLMGVFAVALTLARAEEPFPLVVDGRAAPIWFDASDARVVSIAVNDLAADIERVSGVRSAVAADSTLPNGPVVLVGTLGHSALIDRLVADGRLEVSDVAGKWETFVITTIDAPLPGLARALVIAGSDRRGTAFGVYELSQQIGVSPWHWWADVPAKKSSELLIPAGTRRLGPPSVQYRGIFINDEDWGLQAWAAQTFEPENGGIGPKTYEKVFELLLRLKANTLWPAMHACTKPFNAFPENARLADDYAIVMGSSHAEPMLRNNVGEWTAPKPDYNYVTNREGVLKYWDERVASNGRFENIYTVGMRGVHDSQIQGTKTDEERIRVLEQVFADQRALLAKHVRPEVEQVPQMFCAYKEVLDLYRQGLKVPEDVTIVWPDDNFGYVRNFATPEEQRTRSGGFGVYYHISYLGRPLAYLWLCTTPPALIWEEMHKAYDHGARKIWIVNVGDIKPAEIGTEFFLQMAWDIDRWQRDNLPTFLTEWAAREFGPEHAAEIASILGEFHQLSYQRKPEHLQWWLPKEDPRPGPLTPAEVESRLQAWTDLTMRMGALQADLILANPERLAATYELLTYPVLGAAQANLRYFLGESAARGGPDAAAQAEAAQAMDARLGELTSIFGAVERGKWTGFMRLEPADDDWKSMRIAPWAIPTFSDAAAATAPAPDGNAAEAPSVIALEAERFSSSISVGAASWQVVPGLGRTGEGSVAVFPTTMAAVPVEKADSAAPRLDYEVAIAEAGDFALTVYLIPTHPISGTALRFAVGVDHRSPQLVELEFKDGSSEWSQGVLNNTRVATATVRFAAAGPHVFSVYGLEPGVVVDKIVLSRGNTPVSYLGSEAQAR